MEYESGGGQCNCPSGDIDLGDWCTGYKCANGDCVTCGDECSPQECVQPGSSSGSPYIPSGFSLGGLPDCDC